MTDGERRAYEREYWPLIGAMTVLDQMIDEKYPEPDAATDGRLVAEVRDLRLRLDALTAVWVNEIGEYAVKR